MKNQALNDLLRQWLRGEVRRSEESRLERSAQEDPFLSDAWEGYSQQPQAEHLQQIERLQAKITARTQGEQKKPAPILRWFPRMAAAAAILLVIGFSWRWLNNPRDKEELAIQVPNIEQEAKTKNAPGETTTEVADATSSDRPSVPAPNKKAGPSPSSPIVAVTEEAAKLDKKEAPANGLLADEVQVELAEAKPKIKDDAPGGAASTRSAANLAEKEAAKPVSPPPAATRDFLAQPVPTIGGIVMDNQGQRAAGVPVQKNANTFAITNRDGAFELPSAAPAQVQLISNDDFESKSVRLDDNNEKVVLQRKTIASKKSFDASDRREGVGYPSPEGGFEKFEQYISDNLETPFEAKRNLISGDVTLEFTFEKDGSPTRISVLRSLGFGCDQAAEHLIENGPKWRNVKPGVWVIYKVTFK
ncbi:MAG TPA: energy transducer TonB [Haliscomenobacter sp.]|uniref:energy transducer TonB n=1 Tax=Haliscomenobacter sp. TaxID=2717303 RepID=UPI002C5BF3FE|nr:energy transducer TonB [Haliscomenobacter sp.]HOY17327.1 energy transducer TonB [Haliscomenobacter sp.]